MPNVKQVKVGSTTYDIKSPQPYIEYIANSNTVLFKNFSVDVPTTFSDLIATDDFKIAVTHPIVVKALSSDSSFIVQGILFNEDPNILTFTTAWAILFPDTTYFGGKYVNGVYGTLAYSEGDGWWYLDNMQMHYSVTARIAYDAAVSTLQSTSLDQANDPSRTVTGVTTSAENIVLETSEIAIVPDQVALASPPAYNTLAQFNTSAGELTAGPAFSGDGSQYLGDDGNWQTLVQYPGDEHVRNLAVVLYQGTVTATGVGSYAVTLTSAEPTSYDDIALNTVQTRNATAAAIIQDMVNGRQVHVHITDSGGSAIHQSYDFDLDGQLSNNFAVFQIAIPNPSAHTVKVYTLTVDSSTGSVTNQANTGVASPVVLTYEEVRIATKTSDLTNDGSDGNAAYLETDETAYRSAGIPYGVCDATSTSTAFTATVPGITELRDGVCMLLKNSVVTSASGFTINVNGLGAKPSYSNMAVGNPVTPTNPTRETTIFNINYSMLFIYSSTIVSGGGWICYRGYDANTNTIGYQVRTNSSTLPAQSAIYRYRILFTSADDSKWVPANNSSSTNATAARTPTTTPINPFGQIVYYGSTTTISAGSNPGATVLWQQYPFSLGYSFNNTGSALVLPYPKPIYLKCAPQANGSAIIDATTPYVTALPSTDDGKIYIYLGRTYSATNIELVVDHPVYYYKNGGIRRWTGHYSSLLSIDGTDPTQLNIVTI